MKRIAVLLAAIGAGVAIVIGAGSLRRPVSMIENSLLRLAPIGSSTDDVLRAVEAKGWEHSVVRNVGFLKQKAMHHAAVVGSSSLEAHLGDYGVFFRTSVDAYWGFDRDGRLLEVWVWKTTDAP